MMSLALFLKNRKELRQRFDYQRRRAHLITYLKSEQGGGFSQEEAELAATEHMIKQDALVSVDGVPFEFRNGNLQRVQIVHRGWNNCSRA